jgi:hypothetical protein
MSISMKPVYLLCLPALLMVAACGGTSPVNSDPEDHAEVVDRSRREGTVVISLDTIFNIGVPYAVIRSAPSVLPGRINGVGAEIHTLSGANVMYTIPVALYGDHYVSYRFDDGRYVDTAWIGYHESMLEDARTIVRAGLLSRDSINQPQARAFVLQHPKPAYRERRRGEMVTRDRSPMVMIREREIWQSGVRIGRYDSTGFTLSGLSFSQFTINYIDSAQCATITYEIAPADTSSAVVTTRDGKPHVVRSEASTPLLRTVVWYLVRQSYL